MKFIYSKNADEGAKIGGTALAKDISDKLKAGKRVLWLIPGGSNIPISVRVMELIRESVESNFLKNLTVTLTDERYGSVGHKDSNWKQLEEAGFRFEEIQAIPVLVGLPLEETVSRYGRDVREAMGGSDFRIGQFGIGPDGHIAGILPDSPAAVENESRPAGEVVPALGYQTQTFTRVTLTFGLLSELDAAYAFAFGANKREAIGNLLGKDLNLAEQPAQVLKKIPEAYLFSDIEVKPLGYPQLVH